MGELETLPGRDEGISRLDGEEGLCLLSARFKASACYLRARPVGWAFVHDPQKGPGVTGQCPKSGGTLMAVSLTSQQCLWWGGVGTSPAEGFWDYTSKTVVLQNPKHPVVCLDIPRNATVYYLPTVSVMLTSHHV